ncbi:MAG: type II toxin-antitoxin system HicA family toxin [Proteobacteria bacterium]|nr:type II toxin-antitoxin system HicA family toxin [Pseudomonadota bacterium]
MSTAEKTLERMRNNPRDWRIEDVISVAERYGIEIRNKGGSHHAFSYPGIYVHVNIPAHKPIKSVYIKQFLALIGAIEEAQS